MIGCNILASSFYNQSIILLFWSFSLPPVQWRCCKADVPVVFVRGCMCICTDICIDICLFICTDTCIFVCICFCICTDFYIHISLYLSLDFMIFSYLSLYLHWYLHLDFMIFELSAPSVWASPTCQPTPSKVNFESAKQLSEKVHI